MKPWLKHTHCAHRGSLAHTCTPALSCPASRTRSPVHERVRGCWCAHLDTPLCARPRARPHPARTRALAGRWGSPSSNPSSGGCLPPGALPVSPRGSAGLGGPGRLVFLLLGSGTGGSRTRQAPVKPNGVGKLPDPRLVFGSMCRDRCASPVSDPDGGGVEGSGSPAGGPGRQLQV